MATLSLLPRALASPGARFIPRADPGDEACDGCPVRRMCFSLPPDRPYEVLAVRPVKHPCGLHDEGQAHVVEVRETTFASTLPTKHLRGTAATWQPPPCHRPDCGNWSLCNKVGPVQGIRYGIERVGEAVDCPAGYDLKRVDLRHL